MPLVAFTSLPTFKRLQDEKHDVLDLNKAQQQDIRELHVGLLNMMPDASLRATERQFMRLVGDCNQVVQIYVHLFTLPAIAREANAQAWIDAYYEDFKSIQKQGLDALIISGANPQSKDLQSEVFWGQLTEVIDWAKVHVTSTLCACLASHAVLEYLYQIRREKMPAKKWGVFEHRLTSVDHPLTRHINTRFDVPHSRFNQVSKRQLEAKGLKVLAQSLAAGVHLAVSHDGLRFVFFQGHPEYDNLSLLKEYKREIERWFNGQRTEFPEFPENYFNATTQKKLIEYRQLVERCKQSTKRLPEWPEKELAAEIDNTWRDTALSTFNNWLGCVYQVTHSNPKIPFMQGIDPERPLAYL
ncbi:homoserine O-succinyltransferase MetA [Aliikangiella sp. IMCC44653]